MAKNDLKKGEGIVIRVQGAIVDVGFKNEVPSVYEALSIELDNKKKLILENEFQLGNNEARALALGSTDGLKRGTKVTRTFNPIRVPIGEKTLGRVFNVLGETIDGAKPLEKTKINSIHQDAPPLSEQKAKPEILETGIKVINLISPFTK